MQQAPMNRTEHFGGKRHQLINSVEIMEVLKASERLKGMMASS
jgi:hypothetical protein